MPSPCVVVPRREAEPARQRLVALGILNGALKIRSRGDDLLLPITRVPEDLDLATAMEDFETVARPPRTYRDVCLIPESLRELLPTSFDQVGDIIVVKLEDPLLPHAEEIGRAILQVHHTAKVVAVDGGVKSAFRIRSLRVVAGEPRTVTEHREHGVRLRVDLALSYFSPRLATERLRVARLGREGETVVDLFSGVGPLALLVAAIAKPKAVYAVDANPEAVKFLQENIRLNRASVITAVRADAADFLATVAGADRLVMDLPHAAKDFLPAALVAVKPGGTIHYYEILDTSERDDRVVELETLGRDMGRPLTVTAVKTVHAYSPSQALLAFDLSVA